MKNVGIISFRFTQKKEDNQTMRHTRAFRLVALCLKKISFDDLSSILSKRVSI